MQSTDIDGPSRKFAVYANQTGLIDSTQVLVEHCVRHHVQTNPHLSYIEVAEDIDGATHYVINEEVTPRPIMPLQVENMTVRNIPVGAKVWSEGEPHICNDGEVEMEYDQPGTYTLLIECPPYKTEELTLEN